MPPRNKEFERWPFTIIAEGKHRMYAATSHEALSMAIQGNAFAICAHQGQLLKTYTDINDWEDFRKYHGLTSEEAAK